MELEAFLKKSIAEESRVYGVPSLREGMRTILRGYLHSLTQSDVFILLRIQRILSFALKTILIAVVIYACTVKFFAIPPFLYITYFIFCVVISPIIVSFGTALFIMVTGYNTQSKRLRVHRKYAPRESAVRFTDEEYVLAARALKTWETLYLDRAIAKYSERIVDLCILARVVDLYQGKVSRIVSLRAIAQDTEAGWDE